MLSSASECPQVLARADESEGPWPVRDVGLYLQGIYYPFILFPRWSVEGFGVVFGKGTWERESCVEVVYGCGSGGRVMD